MPIYCDDLSLMKSVAIARCFLNRRFSMGRKVGIGGLFSRARHIV